jgi:hypothetical protein
VVLFCLFLREILDSQQNCAESAKFLHAPGLSHIQPLLLSTAPLPAKLLIVEELPLTSYHLNSAVCFRLLVLYIL